jgi:Spy/CpxP family protein refolding chaperone
MNTQPNNIKGDPAAPARRTGWRWLVAGVLALAAGAAGASFAHGGPGMSGHHGHFAHGAADPAAMDAHIEKMVEQFAADASPDQKARVVAIARAALADLRTAHAQLRSGHARAHQLLMAPTIDRFALEQLRVEQMKQVDFISRRILAAVEDVADVLTPEQRARFAEHLKARMH